MTILPCSPSLTLLSNKNIHSQSNHILLCYNMDPINMEKFQAIKRYKRKEFIPTVIHYLESILMLGLFLSCPLWLTVLCSNLKVFFLVSLPKMWSIVFGPKCLFILCNVIIVFLVGESKLSNSSPSPDIYDLYVERSKSLRSLSSTTNTSDEAKEKESVTLEKALVEEEEQEEKCEEVEKEEAEESESGEEEKVEEVCEEYLEEVCEELEGEEESGLPADELNKRVEEFIAKINMQRRLEERMLVCCG